MTVLWTRTQSIVQGSGTTYYLLGSITPTLGTVEYVIVGPFSRAGGGSSHDGGNLQYGVTETNSVADGSETFVKLGPASAITDGGPTQTLGILDSERGSQMYDTGASTRRMIPLTKDIYLKVKSDASVTAGSLRVILIGKPAGY